MALPENCMKEWFTVLVEDNIDQLEETLSDELRSRECYTNNLFPANKWVKPFCMVNWRLLLLLLFIYLFIYLYFALLIKLTRSYFNPEDSANTAVHHENDDGPSTEHQEHTSLPVKKKCR